MNQSKIRSVRNALLLGGGVAALVLGATGANAQDLGVGVALDQENTAIESEEGQDRNVIIVTAQKIEQSLQDIPVSVSVVDAKAIEEQNIINLNDVIEQTANITGNSGAFAIRGINSNNVSGAGLAGLASIYVDGSPLPNVAVSGSGPLDVWDLDQVEVLRGPQSTLQGRNALAGAIVINTADPTYYWTGRARAIAGTKLDERRLAAAVGGPLIDDQVAIRIAAEYTDTNGIISSPNLSGNNDEQDTFFIRAKVLLEPEFASGLSVLLSYTYDEKNLGDDVADLSVDDTFDNRTFFGNVQSINDTRLDIGVLTVDYDFTNELSLTSISSINVVDNRIASDQDRTPDDIEFSDFLTKTTTFTQETRLQYDGDRFKGVVGGYYSNIDTPDRVGTTQFQFSVLDNFPVAALLQAPPFGLDAGTAGFVVSLYQEPVGLNAFLDNPSKIETYAVFADFSYEVSDAINVFGGFRYDREKQEITTGNIITRTSPLPNPTDFGPLAPIIEGLNAQLDAASSAASSQPVTSESPTFSAFLPKFGVGWDIDDDRSLNFVVQRGYRSGGVGINNARAESFSFDQEFIWNYELSLRSQWLDGALTLNANAYYVDWTDQQVTVQLSDNSFDTETQNAGSSNLYGFEIETNYRPDDNLNLYASVGYAKTEFTDFIAFTNAGEVDLAGNEFPNARRFTLASGATWSSDSGFIVNVNANYNSGAFPLVNPQVERTLDARFLTNFRAGWENETFGIFVTGNNIFGEEYRVGTLTDFDANGQIVDAFARFGEPRVFAVQLEARF
ncbi:MAG: TonB-dependent receptor [Erythrobacter sp.]|uniref:TonB-dependent receptor n=1 Tax=Erythrobacter sp. TaxID=1042 RepID=UPI0032645E7E